MVRAERGRLEGFSLIELLITLAIIGVLVAWALPSYKDYVTRGNLVTATNALSSSRVQMEQYFQDNRTYMATTTTPVFTPPCSSISSTAYTPFTVVCSNLSATGYLITATGNSGTSVAGFAYTIDQSANQQTTALPASWGTVPQSCWIVKKGSGC